MFELTMPNCGSWNGKWSQADRVHVRVRRDRDVPKELWDRCFYYRWDDGWEACVSVTHMPAREARALEKRSSGFSGYDWMITSIIKFGAIYKEKDWEAKA